MKRMEIIPYVAWKQYSMLKLNSGAMTQSFPQSGQEQPHCSSDDFREDHI